MRKISLQEVYPESFFDKKDDISKSFWGIPVDFEKGNNYLVEASSGTGKSSLCSFLYGSRKDYTGNLFFDGKELQTISQKEWDRIRKNEISILFQDLRLFPELTSIENIQIKNDLTNFKTQEEIEIMLEFLGIIDKKDQLISRISIGQQQRVALIRAICQPYDFIILDEPVSHLDEDNAYLMGKLVSNEANIQKAGIISTSVGNYLPIEYNQIFKL